MELVHERSVAALYVSGLLLFLTITASYGLTHLLYSNQADINRFFWWTERAAGLTAYLLLTLAVLVGMTVRTGLWDKVRLRSVVSHVHQYLSLLFIPFVVLHMFALSQDTTVPFSLEQLTVPFQASYRPVPTGLGVLAFYGVAVLVVSSIVRERIGVRVWRGLHWLSLPVYIFVSLHGLLSGTDSATAWARWLYAISFGAFVLTLVVRVRALRDRAA